MDILRHKIHLESTTPKELALGYRDLVQAYHNFPKWFA